MLRPSLLLIFLTLPTFAGLKDGEVTANLNFDSGSTTLASQNLSLVEVNAGASASLTGTMNGPTLNCSAFINNTAGSTAAFGTSRVDFADTVTLTAPGVATGNPITIRMAWNVNGSASSSGSSQIRTLSQSLLQGPQQTWTRESNNFGDPVTVDSNGRAEFDFTLSEGVATTNNILLTGAIQSITGLPGSTYFGSYSGNAGASLSFDFLEVVSVKDQHGNNLPIWSITSDSLFNYGQGNGTPVLTKPTLTIEPISGSQNRFTWPTSELETYLLRSSTNGTTWTTEATVVGDDNTATVDLSSRAPACLYRLEYDFTP